MSNILEVKNLNKYIGNHKILDNISFEVPKGSIVGFVGSNGAGKSTTFKTILGLCSKDSGVVEIFGEKNIEKHYLIKERIGTVFDSIGLPTDLNILKLNSIFKNIYKNWKEDKFFHLIDYFSLPLKSKISTYSRGMSMKLSISIALSHGAELLLLDEATSGLDNTTRINVLNILEKYNHDGGILLSSHITNDIEKIATHLVILNDGKIILKDSKANIEKNYAIIEIENLRDINQSNIVYTKKNSEKKIKVLVYEKRYLPDDVEILDTNIDEVIILLTGGDEH